MGPEHAIEEELSQRVNSVDNLRFQRINSGILFLLLDTLYYRNGNHREETRKEKDNKIYPLMDIFKI